MYDVNPRSKHLTLIICVVCIIVIMVVSVAAVVFFFNRTSPQRVNELRDQAFAAAEKQNYTEAEKLYKQAIEQEKSLKDELVIAKTNADLAAVYGAEGDHSDELIYLQKALNYYQHNSASGKNITAAQLDQDGVTILLQMARAYTKNKQLDQGREKYKEVLSRGNVSNLTDETRNKATTEYGDLLRSMGLKQDAEKMAIQLAATDDDIGSTNDKMVLGMKNFNARKYPEAERSFLTVQALAQNHHQGARIAQSLIWAGKAQVAQRKYQEAESSFAQASQEPALLGEPVAEPATALSMRAFCRFCIKEPEMPELVKNALTIDPTILSVDHGWLNPISEAYMATSNIEGALLLRNWRTTQLSNSFGPESLPAVQALYELSEFERVLGRSSRPHAKDARAALSSLLAKKSNKLTAYEMASSYGVLAHIDDQLNDPKAATASLKKALAAYKTMGPAGETSVDRARVLTQVCSHLDLKNKEQRQEAELDLRAAIKIIDGRPDSLILPGEIYFFCHKQLADILITDAKLSDARANLALLAPAYKQLNRDTDAAFAAVATERIADKAYDKKRLIAAVDQAQTILTSQSASSQSDPSIPVATAFASYWTLLADTYVQCGELKRSIPCYKGAEFFCKKLSPKSAIAVAESLHYKAALDRLKALDPSTASTPSAEESTEHSP